MKQFRGEPEKKRINSTICRYIILFKKKKVLMKIVM